MVIKHVVPVGATPESKYASWAQHRTAIHYDAADARRAHRTTPVTA